MATERTVLVRLKADANGFNRGLMEAAAGVSALRKEINTTNERTAWLTQGILAIAPAVVPLGAAAVPVFTGLTTQLTVGAAAAGVLALGFHGIGGALKALNDYQIDPTDAHLKKLRITMSQLSSEGQNFVKFLDSLQPISSSLQNTAQAGMFPGITSGLERLVTLAPQVKRIVHEIALGIGQLADEGGSAIAGPKFREFFTFLETDARPILIEMGHTLGHFAAGFANLFVAFLPQSEKFSTGFEKMSESFEKWTAGLSETQGFKDFIAYIDESGPQALDFIEALGKSFLALIEAAAPVGSHLLPVFTQLLDVLSAIASTPLGSTLLAFGSLISLYGRLAAIGSNLLGGGVFGRGIADQTRAIKSSIPTMREFGNAAMHSMHSVDQLNTYFETGAEKAIKSRNAVTGWMRQVGPMAGQAALLGVVMTGLDRKVGLTNTTSLALAGSLAGPIGAAVGGAVGITLDLAHANEALADAVKQANSAVASGDYASATAALKNLQDQTAKTAKEIHDAQSFSEAGSLHGSMTALADVFTHQSAEAEAALEKLTEQRAKQQSALSGIGRGLDVPDMQFGQPFSPNTAAGIKEMTALANRAQPAMEMLGITMERLSTEPAPLREKDVAAIVAWIKNADSAKGRAEAVGVAMSGMSNDMGTAEQKASALTASLDRLITPMMNLGQANDAFHQALNDLPQALSKSSKTLRGYSDAAIQNRGAIRGLIGNVKDQVEAMAGVPGGASKASAALKAGRQAIIEQGRAAGLNAGQIQHMINVMGLTPKLIKTIIQADTGQALGQIQSVKSALAGIDRVVNVHVNVTRSTNALLADVNRADGGPIPGPRYPYGDKVLAFVAPGEEIISNRYGQADRYRRDRDMGRIPRYADGGTVASTSTHTGGDSGVADAASRAAHAMGRLQHSVDAAKESVDKEKQARDAVRQKLQEVSSNVTGGFRSDFLDTSDGNPWASSSPFSILRGNIRDARAYRRALADLKRRGVSGNFAAQIDTLNAANQVDALSNRQLHNLEHLFAVRQHASAAAGQLAGQTAYGAQLREANAELHHANAHLRSLEHEMKHMRAEAARHAKATGDAVGKQINGGSAKAARRVRNR